MGASLIVSIFLAFSLSLSWFSGDKENGFLEDTIQETMAKQEAINNQYRLLTVKMREKEDRQKVLESKLKRELKKQKKLKRSLAMEKRKMRIAVESGKAVDVEAERERIRKEVEKRASKEIAKLEQRRATVEQEKKRIEENARRGLVATRDKNSEAWVQAEAAKARAQDAVLKYKALKSELENLRASREQADRVLREQAMARKKADEALARIKAERASLKARLREAERTLTLTSAPAKDKRVSKDAAPLVTEIEKARDILRRKIEMRNRTITELERKARDFKHNTAKLIKDNEKEKLRTALENKARRVAELEKALEQSKTREQALRANLKSGPTTASATGDPVERARIEALRAKVQNLQAKLRETENNKKAFAEKARARIEALRKRTQELDTRNMQIEKHLKDGRPQRAGAMPSVKAPQHSKDKRELQAKLSGDGLVDLRSKASNYVAQKMVDRNVELEAKLEETRLQLAEAESAFRNARYPASMELRPGNSDTSAIIARYRKASTTITILNKRNVALEAKADETARALAQAEASRFIIEQLHQQNLELKKKLRAMDEAKKAAEKALALTAGLKMPLEGPTAPVSDLEKSDSPVFNLAQVSADSPEATALPDVASMALVSASAEVSAAPEALNSDKPEALPVAPVSDVNTAPAALLGLPRAANIENPSTPVMVASIEKGLDLESAMHSIIPVATAAKPAATALKSPAQLKAERRASAKELREIVNKIQDLNASLADLNKGHGSESPSLVEIHEGLRTLKKRIVHDLDKGILSMKDIMPYTGVEGAFTFYVIKKGETAEEIAGRKDLYGDSSMWPLLYRYNQTRFDQPDISSSGRLLIIYKNLSANEKEEAVKKAQALGQWAKWKDEDKRAWVEDWIM